MLQFPASSMDHLFPPRQDNTGCTLIAWDFIQVFCVCVDYSCCCCVLYAPCWAIADMMNLKRDLWLHQNGFVLAIHGIVASQQCRSCQYVVKRAERSYFDESDVVL